MGGGELVDAFEVPVVCSQRNIYLNTGIYILFHFQRESAGT